MRCLSLMLILAACGPAPEQPVAEAPPVPKQICDQSRDGLEKMRAKGAIDFDDSGSATVPQDAWMAMGAVPHGQLAQMLAFHAACTNPDKAAERHIVIRNEAGVALMERDVPTSVGLNMLEEE